jgi:hypothetical protein
LDGVGSLANHDKGLILSHSDEAGGCSVLEGTLHQIPSVVDELGAEPNSRSAMRP